MCERRRAGFSALREAIATLDGTLGTLEKDVPARHGRLRFLAGRDN